MESITLTKDQLDDLVQEAALKATLFLTLEILPYFLISSKVTRSSIVSAIGVVLSSQ